MQRYLSATTNSIGQKFRTALRRPDLVRNRLLGELNYWPVSRLTNAEVRDLPVFCISLRGSERRRSLMRRQASTLGLDRFEFIDAAEAASLEVADLMAKGDYDPVEASRIHGAPLTMVEIACSLSHGRVYRRIVEERLAHALVLEDDALFNTRNLDALRVSSLPEDHDVVFLNSFLEEEPPRGHISAQLYTDFSYAGSSAAYLVSRMGAEKLLHAMKPVIHAADGLLGRSMDQPPGEEHAFRQKGARTTIKSYIVYPHCALNGSTCNFHKTTIA